MKKQVLKVKKLNEEAFIPEYKTPGASGFDLAAYYEYIIDGGCTGIVKTGLAFEIPKGYELQIRPRSGMSAKTKIRIANSPGTIDSDFTGEVGIIIDNLDKHGYEIKKGDRIAQAVLVPVIQAKIEVVEELTQTERGDKGFGSTGLSEVVN